MGCCPFMQKKPRSPSEYQIMQDGQQAPKPSNINSLDEDCQQIDVENDDFFEKKEQDQLASRNPTKRMLTIKDFHSVKVHLWLIADNWQRWVRKGATGGKEGQWRYFTVKVGKLYAMKIIKKEMINQRNQQIHTRAERKILENMRCPFIVQLHYAFQSATRLYLIMDFMIGGELFFHLRKEKKFSEQRARLYAAQITMALDYLHKKNTIYRDLKPQNILMGADGYLKITDFGLSKVVMSSNEKSYTFCGTPEYLAPEIYQNRGHDFTCDWWSLGALIYQMLSGAPPFYSKDKQKMLEDRLHKQIVMKDYFSEDAVDLLKGLLALNPKVRLGRNGGQEIKSHPWFKTLDWDALYNKKIPMLFKPEVIDDRDLGYFDKVFTDEVIKETPTRAIKQDYEDYTYSKEYSVVNSAPSMNRIEDHVVVHIIEFGNCWRMIMHGTEAEAKCTEQTHSHVNQVMQFTTNRSQPVEGRSFGRSTSIGNLDDAISLPNMTVKHLDKELIMQNLAEKVRLLEMELLEQQQERRSEIEMIKKHVNLLQSEMHFMEQENTQLTRNVRSLQEYNLQLLKVFSDKHLKNKENMQPAEPISIVPEYAFVQPPEKKSSKKELGRRQSNKKKSEQRRISKSKKDIEKPPRSLEVQRLKEHIHGLDRKIRQSRDKLLSVSKKML